MAATPSHLKTEGTAGVRVKVAGPPPAPRLAVFSPPETSLPPLEWKWWTPEAKKGWAWSFAMHSVLLLILAFWFFSPQVRGPVAFDSRLAGSERGVPEGEMLMGGLNTPLPMAADPMAQIAQLEASVDVAPAPELKFATFEQEATNRVAKKASGGGGEENDNPGAGDGDGFGLARFGHGGELVRGVQVKVGDPQFTLIWNTDNVDLDLHVIEPGGKEVYWESPKGNQGGELDVDNTKGFGPENIYWLVESDGPGSKKVMGPGPPGVYRWFVVYWGAFGGTPRPTHWQVRVKHAGRVKVYDGKFRALNERSKIYTLKVDPPAGTDAASPD
jgi:hypothetical protein